MRMSNSLTAASLLEEKDREATPETAIVRTLIACSPGMVEQALRATLNALPAVDVVGTAPGCLSALHMVREKAPALLVIDANLPEGEVKTLLRELRTTQHQTRSLVLTRDIYQRQRLLSKVDGNNRLTLGSPAIDAGDNSLVKAGVTTDLDNRPRITDGDGDSTATVDMGAFEVLSACPPAGTTVLYVDKDATAGAQTGLDWANAFLTLQDALLLSDNCRDVIDEIWVAEGIYYPDRGGYFGDPWTAPITERQQRSFRLTDAGERRGTVLYGGFAGTESSIGDRGDPALNLSVLSGDIEQNDVTNANGVLHDPSGIVGRNSNHVLTQIETTFASILDRFTVTGGDALGWFADEGNTPAEQGGGILSKNGQGQLADSRFQGNRAVRGGGLHLGFASNYELNNVVFENNWAQDGGGMSIYDESHSFLGLVTFEGNRATVRESEPYLGNGGGLYIGTDVRSETKIEGSLFKDNIADNNGGGLFIEPGPFADKQTPVTLVAVRFRSNQATANGAGAGNGGGGGRQSAAVGQSARG